MSNKLFSWEIRKLEKKLAREIRRNEALKDMPTTTEKTKRGKAPRKYFLPKFK